MTRQQLLAMGGIFAIAKHCPTCCGQCFQCTGDEKLPKQEDSSTVILPNGAIFKERPSENGNGWYAGEIYNIDYLIYDEVA